MQIITESEIKNKTFQQFIGKDDDVSESFYFLVEEECLVEINSSPLILAEGIMVTNELEAIEALREHEGICNRICYINSKDLKIGEKTVKTFFAFICVGFILSFPLNIYSADVIVDLGTITIHDDIQTELQSAIQWREPKPSSIGWVPYFRTLFRKYGKV